VVQWHVAVPSRRLRRRDAAARLSDEGWTMTADCGNESGMGLGTPAKVIIADDHPLVCAALTHALRSAMPSATILTAPSLGAIETMIAEHPDLDLALLDLHMPGARGFSALLLLRG